MKIDYQRTTLILSVVLALSLLVNVRVLAGNIDSSAAPGATSSYTLEDIYNRLTAGTAGSPGVFTEPVSGPGSTMHTLNEIMAKAPAVDTLNPATAADVISGKTFWGLGTGGAWGLQTGTFPIDGLRATGKPPFNFSRILDGSNSDGNPGSGPDTELADVYLLLNPISSAALPDLIGVPSSYRYSSGGIIYEVDLPYPVSISSLIGTPSYDPYTGEPLAASHSYNPLWVDYNSGDGSYSFNLLAPIALRLRSVLSELASTAAAMP